MASMVPVKVGSPPGAQGWCQRAPTRQTGPPRQCQSPPLTPGKEYAYEIKAQWREGDRDVTQTRQVRLHAGDWVTVVFTTPSANETTNSPPASSTPPPRPIGS